MAVAVVIYVSGSRRFRLSAQMNRVLRWLLVRLRWRVSA
jgi:hypothetical protein